MVAASASASAAVPAPLSKTVVFTTSGLGGIFGWVIVHPFNTIAVRMNLASMAGNPPSSFGSFTSSVISKEGFASLYAGKELGADVHIAGFVRYTVGEGLEATAEP